MRLIDADALIESMERSRHYNERVSYKNRIASKDRMKKTCIADVKSAPTVDAIPVAWLERTRENYIAVATVLRMWHKEQEAQDG